MDKGIIKCRNGKRNGFGKVKIEVLVRKILGRILLLGYYPQNPIAGYSRSNQEAGPKETRAKVVI